MYLKTEAIHPGFWNIVLAAGRGQPELRVNDVKKVPHRFAPIQPGPSRVDAGASDQDRSFALRPPSIGGATNYHLVNHVWRLQKN